jgi:hypothetical protein
MTDEQLIVRHVRLCECGSIAGHDSICKPSRLAVARNIDTEWQEAETDRRAVRWEKRKQQLDMERRTKRSGLDAWELHRLAVERVAKISTVAAAATGRSTPSTKHPSANLAEDRRGAQTLDDDPRWRSCWDVIERQLNRAHLLIDEAEGHGPVAVRALSAEEKDALIVDPSNDGLSVAQLIQDLGADICGSASTVSRVRSRFRDGRCTRSGLAPATEGPDASCRCPTCRRAI